ncbi:MAG TPA: response regulator [Caulobacterales bacterium]|nr:response regulator [Caulobacterales bacterium]
MEDDEFDPSALSALVVDNNHYQRGISLDQLRGMGFRRAVGASDVAEAWDLLCKNNPDVVLVEWFDAGTDLDFVRRIRTSEETPNRAVSVFMLTSRGNRADVEAARLAGVNGYLRKPISLSAFKKRVRAVVLHPRPFIVTATYVGPCRRRRQDPAYAGPWRRLDDVQPGVQEDDDAVDVNVQLARACVAALDACARNFVPGDAVIARKVFRSAQDLCEVAERIGDTTLLFGAKEMVRYLQAQGATARLDPEVVRTHIAALHQLVHLPHALRAERDNVAQGLKRMVDKKLRQSGQG